MFSTSLHHCLLQAGRFVQLVLAPPHTSERDQGPSVPQGVPMLASLQIQGLDLQPVSVLAREMASQSCSYSWH